MEHTMLTIVNLLIRKGVFTKEEYQTEIERVRRVEWDKRHQQPDKEWLQSRNI